MEYFDVVDDLGNPTGVTVDRERAHAEGIPHRTAHVWIVRRKNDKVQILLQKRCENKDSFPGCYDISSAGHIPAGVEYIDSAIRELKEELGVDIRPEALVYCGVKNIVFDSVFHDKEFHDKQISKVFMLWLDMEEDEFTIQQEEIEEVKWMDFQECKIAVRDNTIPNCILLDELEMLEPHLYF